jgi:hypothetical protein
LADQFCNNKKHHFTEIYWESSGPRKKKRGLVLPLQTPPVEMGIHIDKEKNWALLDPSHWVHENTIPKTGCHHFWPGLIHYLMSCPKVGTVDRAYLFWKLFMERKILVIFFKNWQFTVVIVLILRSSLEIVLINT